MCPFLEAVKPQCSAPQNDMDTKGSQPAKTPKIHLHPFPEIGGKHPEMGVVDAHAGDSGAEEFLLRVLWTFRRC
jgi:hypothetical protein